MKKFLITLLFVLITSTSWADKVYWYNATSHTGGGTSSLDSIDGQNLIDGDKCIVVTASGQSFLYNLDVDSALTEDSTNLSIIAPDSNTGDKRWILMWSGGRVLVPDATIDQGDSAIAGTLAWHISNASGNATTVTVLPGEYKVDTDITVPSTMYLIIEDGGYFKPTGTTIELTVNSPEHIKASPRQKIVDGSSNTADPLLFTNSGRVYPEWWGAGYTADAITYFTLAVASLPAAGGILDLNSRSFRIDSTIALVSGLTVEGGTIDASNMASGDNLFEAVGTIGTPRAALGNITAGDNSTTVTDAGSYFSANDWVVVEDTNTWSSGDHLGEWILIKSIAGTTITFQDEFSYPYATAQTAQVQPFTFMSNVKLLGITATGGGAGNNDQALLAQYVDNFTVRDCKFVNFEDRALQFVYAIHYNVDSNYFVRSNKDGFGYGISQTACAFGMITDNHFEYCRHSMTIGGSEHPTRYVTFKDNSVFGSTDAGVDTHAQAEFIIITGNLIQSGESDGEGDGIYTAGRNITISNNTIMNTGNHGISVLNGVADTNLKSSYTITGNTIVDVPDKGICINQGTTGGIIYGLIISNNSISFPGDMGIRIHAEYAGITHVLINGNYISGVADAGDSVIQIDAATSYDVKWFSITGNVLHRADDADNCIEMVGADATSVTYGAITGNVIHNGTYGVKGTNDDYLVIDSNVFSSMATGDTDVAGTNTIGDNES